MPFHLEPLGDGPVVPLAEPIVLVGRDDECDLILASKRVSRMHCCLAEVNGRLVVRDLGSTNGVRVNGGKVAEARLAEGDEVRIGPFKFRVGRTGAPPTAAET
ncbi:MAG: FHA domain-containing protein [Gemmataceae bacterium]|nr:FHA domain-containing protein [Gemmataceae bacterium]